MAEVVRPYRGVSADDRVALRRARLLDACLDIVFEKGVADTTAEAVCAQAGLSKRYFYESFADREAILVAALDDFFKAAQEAILPALLEPAATIEARLTQTVVALVKAVSADERAARLYVESPRVVALEERRVVTCDDFAELILRFGFQLDPEPPNPRAEVVALLIVSGTTEVLSRWLSGNVDLDENGLVDAISGIGMACAELLEQS